MEFKPNIQLFADSLKKPNDLGIDGRRDLDKAWHKIQIMTEAIECSIGRKFGDVLYIQDEGTKRVGEVFLDKLNLNGLWVCTHETTTTSNSSKYFKLCSVSKNDYEIDHILYRTVNFGSCILGAKRADDHDGSNTVRINLTKFRKIINRDFYLVGTLHLFAFWYYNNVSCDVKLNLALHFDTTVNGQLWLDNYTSVCAGNDSNFCFRYHQSNGEEYIDMIYCGGQNSFSIKYEYGVDPTGDKIVQLVDAVEYVTTSPEDINSIPERNKLSIRRFI